jgi:hypothetical protein
MFTSVGVISTRQKHEICVQKIRNHGCAQILYRSGCSDCRRL